MASKDITFCMDPCENTACPRHKNHAIGQETVSWGTLRGTEMCPIYSKETSSIKSLIEVANHIKDTLDKNKMQLGLTLGKYLVIREITTGAEFEIASIAEKEKHDEQ